MKADGALRGSLFGLQVDHREEPDRENAAPVAVNNSRSNGLDVAIVRDER